jgi:hypothetical protein
MQASLEDKRLASKSRTQVDNDVEQRRLCVQPRRGCHFIISLTGCSVTPQSFRWRLLYVGTVALPHFCIKRILKVPTASVIMPIPGRVYM